MNSHELNSVCWPPVGPQDIKQIHIQILCCSTILRVVITAAHAKLLLHSGSGLMHYKQVVHYVHKVILQLDWCL